jgi:hypothetical protein
MMMKTMLGMLIATLIAGAATAQVKGVLITADGQKIDGTIRWKQTSEAYEVVRSGGSVALEMTPDKIRDLVIPEPAALKSAISQVKSGAAAAAIPALKKVIQGYTRLKWDEVATRYLAEAHLAARDAAEARKVCESVISHKPEAAYCGEMAPTYWSALIATDRAAKAEELMGKAIKSGDRRSSAFALIRRGDLILKEGQTAEAHKKALIDGYLRVATLYRDVKDAQPEACEKAAGCFEKIGQTSRAESFRQLARSVK